MTIKIAISYDKRCHNIIDKCCKREESIFFEVFENYFGISSNSKDLVFGKSTPDDIPKTTGQFFVEINKCVVESYKNLQKQNFLFRHLFDKHKDTFPIYESVIFDNKFFLLVYDYCIANKIVFKSITCLNTTTDLTSIAENIDEIREKIQDLRENQNIRALKVSLDFIDYEVNIDNNGYVDIAKPTVFFEDIEPVKKILAYGLKN